MGNNPIWHNDVLGDLFDKKSAPHIEKYEKKLADRKTEISDDLKATNNKINDIKKLLSSETNPNKKNQLSNSLQHEEFVLKNLNIANSEIDNAMTELQNMKDSKQMFKVRDGFNNGGLTKLNIFTHAIEISYNGNLGSLGHELKHGHQFLEGEISFNLFNGSAGLLGDLNDEKAAYDRGYAIDETVMNNKRHSFDNITKAKIQVLKEDGVMPYRKLQNVHNNLNIVSPKRLRWDYYYRQ